MQKITTLFVRDESQRGHPVTDEVAPACLWVFIGDDRGVATVKLDGTNVRVHDGSLYKRQKPKDRDYDVASYVPCDRADPADRWAFEAFDACAPVNGIYELIGPKIQGNPYRRCDHVLISVLPPDPSLCNIDGDLSRSFHGIREYLTCHDIEGIVFHRRDGQLAKIKRRDFGLVWPVAP